jgi:hypothetical protein
LVTFSLAFVTLFIIHLVALPFYWANASSQQGRPFDLYSPNIWTPAVIYYSVVTAIFAILSFELYSTLRKGKANAAVVFIITFFLGGIGLWLFFAFLGLRWGHTMRLTSFGSNPKNEFAFMVATFIVSSASAVFSTLVFAVYRLVRWARNRLK